MFAQFLKTYGIEPGLGLALLIVPLAVLLRYAIFAGSALWFVLANRDRLAPHRIQSVPFTRLQFTREAAYSAISAFVFGAVGIATYYTNQRYGFLAVYSEVADYGWVWLFVSVPAALLVHDFYFYWAHRFMHLPGVFERVHRVHHLSTNPSPLAAFAFHPLEAVVEALAFVVMATIVPLHPAAFLAASTVMISMNVIGYLGYELFPSGMQRNRVLRLVNTATSHNQHHRAFRCNFGLYTLIWDRLFGTLHPKYEAGFAAASGAPLSIQHQNKE